MCKHLRLLPRHTVRLAWALLASLLAHLAIIGDLPQLPRWQPGALPDSAPPLDVEILSAAIPVQPAPDAESPPVPLKARRAPHPRPAPATATLAPPLALSPPSAIEVVVNEPPRPERPRDTAAHVAAGPEVPAASAQPASAQAQEAPVRRLPPNGKLTFRFYWGRAHWLAGEAVHQWTIQNDYYTLSSNIRTTGLFRLLHPLTLVETSKGRIVGETLQTLQFSTQLNDYPMAVAIFNWDSGRYRWFRDKTSFTQPLAANSYDKISYLYQLYLSSAREKYFSSEITTGRRLEHYDILNLGIEDVAIDEQIHPAVHLSRAVASPEMERIDIWLSTAMDNLPLKMTYANQAGDYFEQLIAPDSLPPP